MSEAEENNKALVRRYLEEVWGKGNVAAVDEFMAPNYVEHTGPPGSRPGRDTLKQYVAMYHNAFPDWKSVLHDLLAQGDRVAYRWSTSGTHLGEWAGIPPTDLHMTTRGITIHRIAGGRALRAGAARTSATRRKNGGGSLKAGGPTKRTRRGSATCP